MVESQSVTIRKETVVASVKLLCRELIDSNPKGCEEPPCFKLKSINLTVVESIVVCVGGGVVCLPIVAAGVKPT